jgi:peptidyl-prolyl cis-trans isomerase C
VIRRAFPLVIAASAWSACGGSGAPGASKGPLPAGVLARVDGCPVAVDVVGRVARAEGVTPTVALDHVVGDALLAREAEARGMLDTPPAKLAWDAELARRLLRALLAEARRTPPTEEELRSATSRRWLEIDRPEGSRTVHVVVMFSATDPEEKKARARALAATLRRAIEPAVERAAGVAPHDDAPAPSPRIGPQNDPDPLSRAFREAVQGVDTQGLEVRAEPLPPVAADGRILEPGDKSLGLEYAKAAAALPGRGSLSAIVESPFGAHVILLLERTPAQVLAGEARVARLRDDIVNERARAAQRRLLADRNARSQISPDAPGLLALVHVDE